MCNRPTAATSATSACRGLPAAMAGAALLAAIVVALLLRRGGGGTRAQER
jgi:hypothetical protein